MTIASLRLVAPLLLVATLTRCSSVPTNNGPAPVDRVSGWLADLRILDSLVPALHPPIAHDPGFTTFHAAVAQLSRDVPSLPDESIGTTIQRILVSIGDGHTTIIPDDVGSLAFLALKVDFYWFDDGVHVVSVRPGFGALQNARVTAVGGVPIDDFRQRLAPFVPRDNEQSGRWLGAQLMQYSSLIRATGATWTDAGVPLTVMDVAGNELTMNVSDHDRAALPRLHPPGGLTASTPRYLQRPTLAYWLDSLPPDRTLYVNFNAVRNDSTETLAAFANRVDASLRSGAFANVIVDVRLNNGGDNTLLAPLLATLEAFDAASATNRIFVIIGRATFSAGQNFVTRLEGMTRAVFVGEATGGRPNHVGDHNFTQLPFSGLQVSVASRAYSDAGPGDQRLALVPDIAVPVLSSDYFANRDPAFDAAMAAIRSSRVR